MGYAFRNMIFLGNRLEIYLITCHLQTKKLMEVETDQTLQYTVDRSLLNPSFEGYKLNLQTFPSKQYSLPKSMSNFLIKPYPM